MSPLRAQEEDRGEQGGQGNYSQGWDYRTDSQCDLALLSWGREASNLKRSRPLTLSGWILGGTWQCHPPGLAGGAVVVGV